MPRIHFKVNGIEHSVGCEVSSTVMLVDYIRETLELRGTKYMCREAGCGACIVAVVKCPGGPTESVNACMVSITSCQDWEITTIEDVGNRKKGYHPIQKTLAEYNGSQCGYCSPAWVMGMYSLLKNKKCITMLETEQSFGSNVCRCTGYRPILDAFKTFATDAPESEKNIMDIEDLQICKKTGAACDKKICDDEDEWCVVSKEDLQDDVQEIKLKDGKSWFKAKFVHDIFRVWQNTTYNDHYMLVSGNTAKGAYPILEYPSILIDISTVQELKVCFLDQNLVIGAGLTITELLDNLETISKQNYFGYLKKFADHLRLVAHIPVRNLGSIAGNLMIKHQYNEFQSDLFLLFSTVDAAMTVVTHQGMTRVLSMQEFLLEDMTFKVILNILLPPLSNEHQIVTYKIMPRSQNAHAIVNAGFLYRLNYANTVLGCRLVFGGLSPGFTRALATERFLLGKLLFTNETLQAALSILNSEMVVVDIPPEPSVEYRRELALSLFYKGLLSLCSQCVLAKRHRSGATKIHENRPVSKGKQIFSTNPTLWPLTQPIPKVEGLIQCAGEAHYTEDMSSLPHEVFAAFVLTTVPSGNIVKIDPSLALKVPGVLAFYTAKDIPGENSFTPGGSTFYTANEEILCDGTVKHFNQPYGIIVATTSHTANLAAKLVRSTYANKKKPEIDIKVTKNDSKRITLFTSIPATNPGTEVTKMIKGSNTIYGQYQFMMENIACVTKPTEEGLEVHLTTQWTDGTQWMISRALKIDENRIDVHVRRLGGAFGIKISRPIQSAIACSLVVQKMNRPCRFIQPLTTSTRALGKRLSAHNDFEVGVNSRGVIQYNNYAFYEDNGYKVNETLTILGVGVYNNAYDETKWNYTCYDATTDNAKNTWCRSPGTFENIALSEFLVERISYELALDPLQVRLDNLSPKYNDLREMSDQLKTTAKYTERRGAVNKFNAENRWKKRGLRWSFVRWTPTGAITLDVNLSVCHGDGTVIITHGAIEMGQGVNTKCIQICAYMLKIPIEKIQVKANNTIIAPNCFISGGSLASQNAGMGTRKACEELLRRLEPIRNQMVNPTWEQLIKNAFDNNVDLQTHAYVSALDVQMYDIFGVALAEVEVDVLTGEIEIRRVDLLQDVGQSVSPEIDIGQIEGAFIFGQGYWTSENLVYNRNTGELLTDRTWNYHVPLCKDIPQDFRIYVRKNSYSTEPIFGAKGTGEPPACLSVVIAFAIREAISAARQESNIPATQWFQIDGPYTVEAIRLATATSIKDFKFY